MATCPSFIQGDVIRVTRLDSCGRPVAGACSTIVTDGFVSVTMSPETQDGQEISVTKANGKICVAEKACDQIKWINTQLTLCAVDIDLVTMMNPTWRKMTNEEADTIGWYESSNLDCATGFALEIWTNTANAADVCDNPNAQGSWGYVLLPWVTGGVVGDLEITNDAVQFQFNGRTKRNAKWGVGPYNVRLNPNTAAPLPLPAVVQGDDPRVFMLTTMAPPTPVCGCTTLTPITPPMPTISVVEDTSDESGKTAKITWTNFGAGPGKIDYDDGVVPDASVGDTGTITHTFTVDGAHLVKFTDDDQPLRTVTAPSITTPFP